MDLDDWNGIRLETSQGTPPLANGSAIPDAMLMADQLFHREMEVKRSQWHIPWADLMMTMFILFAVMYVFASSTRRSSPPAEKDTSPSIASIYNLSKSALKEDGLQNVASVELVPNKAVRILLTSDLLFDTGKADLKSGSIAVLKKVATILRKTPYMVRLVGHTDNVPIHNAHFPSNWELSSARACAVARFLINDAHIDAARFSVSGDADYQPLLPNTTAENRAVNRRVEVIITKERPAASPYGIQPDEEKGTALQNPSTLAGSGETAYEGTKDER